MRVPKTMPQLRISPEIKLSSATLPGLLLSLFLVSGRTGVGRLLPAAGAGVLLEVRLWVVIALVGAIGAAGLNARTLPRPYDVAVACLSIALFVTYLSLSALWSRAPEAGLTKAYELGLLMAVVSVIYLLLGSVSGKVLERSFWRATVTLTGLLALLGVVRILMGGEVRRLAVLGGGPNVFGRNMGLLCIGALFFWSGGRGQKPWLGLAGVAGILVVLSGSRGAMVSLVAALGVYATVARLGFKRLAVAVVSIAGVVIPLLLYTPVGRTAVAVYRLRVVDLLFQGYTSGRDRIYDAAIGMISDNPVLGIGLGGFHFEGFTYPHNIFLEAFVEGGVIAVMLLTLLLGIGGAALWRNRTALCPATTAAWALVLVAAQFSGDFFDSRGVFIFLVLSLASAAHTHLESERQAMSVWKGGR